MIEDTRLISIPDDTGAHPSYNLEWWYYYSFLSGDRGSRYAVMASFFQVGESARFKGHYLIYSLIRLDNGQFEPRSMLDRNLFLQMTGLYFPLYLLGKPADSHIWKQYGSLLKGSLPRPHSWMKQVSVNSNPTKIRYGNAALTLKDDNSQEFLIDITDKSYKLDLKFIPIKQPTVIDEEGTLNGLYYYSSTRNKVTGRIRSGGTTEQVTGQGWFDHQWGRNYGLLKGNGWNWFGLQLDDGRELLVSQMRSASTSDLSNPAANLIERDHSLLSTKNVVMKPLKYWKSLETGMKYPVEWHISIPDFSLELHVAPLLHKQEMPIIGPLRAIWEGACTVAGEQSLPDGRRLQINGKGFAELVGYSNTSISENSRTPLSEIS